MSDCMDRAVKRHTEVLLARMSHADAISEIEKEINAVFGGDADIGDIVGIMAVMGWQRPAHNPADQH